MESCKCFIENNCQTFAPCPNGGSLDPTKFCTCIDAISFAQILKKPHGYNNRCNIWLPGSKPVCNLTVNDCPNQNFVVNKDTCQC